MEKWSTRTFWIGLFERSVSTFVQALVAFILAGGAVALTDVDWVQALNVSGLAFLLSVAKGFITSNATDTAVIQYASQE